MADIRTVLALALRVPVFPCCNVPGDKDFDKKPMTKHAFKDASSDVDVIRAWWRRWPDALIGAPAGIRFSVLDLDLQHAEARQWLDANGHRLPATRTHRTRSGGLHLLFAPHSGMKCSASKLHPHVDTRGAGGYVIWWPAEGLEVLHHSTLADVPEWIAEALRPKSLPAPEPTCKYDSGDAWLRGLVRVVAGASEGQRNRALFWAACCAGEAIRAGKASREWAASVLIEAAARTGLAASEAQRTITSGFARGK
jgi:hypothetical protein